MSARKNRVRDADPTAEAIIAGAEDALRVLRDYLDEDSIELGKKTAAIQEARRELGRRDGWSEPPDPTDDRMRAPMPVTPEGHGKLPKGKAARGNLRYHRSPEPPREVRDYLEIQQAAAQALRAGRLAQPDPRPQRPEPIDLAERALLEIALLAERSKARHKTSFRINMGMAAGAFLLAAGLVVWTAALVQTSILDYRVAFGAGGAGATALFWKRFEPLDKARESMAFAEKLDHAATFARVRIQMIAQVKDPAERDRALAAALAEVIATL